MTQWSPSAAGQLAGGLSASRPAHLRCLRGPDELLGGEKYSFMPCNSASPLGPTHAHTMSKRGWHGDSHLDGQRRAAQHVAPLDEQHWYGEAGAGACEAAPLEHQFQLGCTGGVPS